MLYIISTPIGNLKDISLRAIEALKAADLIACEDTRHSRILLRHYGIETPTTSYYQHNKFTKARYLLSRLKENANIALISDAGTPGILDPGFHLINVAIKNNIALTAIPGPTALIMALVLSGKPTHRFMFEGFLPKKSHSRRRRLQALKELNCTIAFYESCHRLVATLNDIQAIFGNVEIALSRELTKQFEEVKRVRIEEAIRLFSHSKPRGEFVVVI